MQLLFYTSKTDIDKKRLEVAIHDAFPEKTIELFTRFDTLRERFRFLIEPGSIAILLASDSKELLRMQKFRNLLQEIYVILVIPDWQESTIKLAHLLLPRYICLIEDSFVDLIKVLKQINRENTYILHCHKCGIKVIKEKLSDTKTITIRGREGEKIMHFCSMCYKKLKYGNTMVHSKQTKIK